MLHEVMIRRLNMTEGLFDRYFRLLAGNLPSAEYGVIAEATEDQEAATPERLC